MEFIFLTEYFVEFLRIYALDKPLQGRYGQIMCWFKKSEKPEFPEKKLLEDTDLQKLLSEIETNSKFDKTSKNPGLLNLLNSLAKLLVKLDQRAGRYAEKSVELNTRIRDLTWGIGFLTLLMFFLGLPSTIVSCQTLLQSKKVEQKDKPATVGNSSAGNGPVAQIPASASPANPPSGHDNSQSNQ